VGESAGLAGKREVIPFTVTHEEGRAAGFDVRQRGGLFASIAVLAKNGLLAFAAGEVINAAPGEDSSN